MPNWTRIRKPKHETLCLVRLSDYMPDNTGIYINMPNTEKYLVLSYYNKHMYFDKKELYPYFEDKNDIEYGERYHTLETEQAMSSAGVRHMNHVTCVTHWQVIDLLEDRLNI